MRTFACGVMCGVVCSLALWGCESDVDLCGGDVCGVDGNEYGNYCEAGNLGVDVAYAGRCNDTCSEVLCRIDCQYGFLVEDGCPVCTCAPPPACSDDSPCTRGDVCRDGTCMPPLPGEDAAVPLDGGPDATVCPAGSMDCGDGTCTMLGTTENCGACGDVCEVTDGAHGVAVCGRDGCGIECDPNYGDCDGDEVCELLDTKSDCGACGNACAFFGSCDFSPDEGGYVCTCPAGRIDCLGTCVNTSFDGEHCGGCPGEVCAEGQRCAGGVCVDGDACTNPANWYCAEGDASCDVACNGISFFQDEETGAATCTVGSAGVSCFIPPGGGDCDTCIGIAARCCFGG